MSFAVITVLSVLLFSSCKKGKEVLLPENKQQHAGQSRAPQFTTLQVNIPDNPGVFGGYQGSGGNTYVLFVPKGYNSIAQLYNNATGTQVESVPNSIPAGIAGRVLAYSIKGGKYYRASRDIITSGPTQSVTLDLTPTDEAELTAVLNALSSY